MSAQQDNIVLQKVGQAVRRLKLIWKAASSQELAMTGLARRLAGLLSQPRYYLKLVFRRLEYNLGLTVCAILGIVAVLSMVICVPIFSYAVSGEVLRQQLSEKATGTRRGLFSLHVYYLAKQSNTSMDVGKVDALTRFISEYFMNRLGLPAQWIVAEAQTEVAIWRPMRNDVNASDEPYFQAGFLTLEELPNHVKLVDGSWPKPTTDLSAPIEVAIIENAADEKFINVGDRFRSGGIEIIIAGIWRPELSQSSYFFDSPSMSYANLLWVPKETFQFALGSLLPKPVFFASWYVVADEKMLQFDRARQYTQGLVRLDSDLRSAVSGINIDYSPLGELNAYQERAEKLTTLFYVIGGPIWILALLFISLTATISVNQYQQETSVMRGRGMSRWQVLAMNLLESLVLISFSLPVALVLGLLEARIMGRTQSFLNFNNQLDIIPSLETFNISWFLVVALIIIVTRVVPAIHISRLTIVRVKQEQSRASLRPIWERFYLDFLLLLPGIYAFATMKGLAKPAKFIEQLRISSGEHYRDPLLFIAPALFVIAWSMISLRILPLVLRLTSSAIDRFPKVWVYLSLQQIARRPQDHASALLLIMISLSLSIYSASMAKTLDRWLYDSIYYKTGADIAVHEYVLERNQQSPSATSRGTKVTLTELDLNFGSYISVEDHLNLPGVNSATRVGKYNGTYSYGAGEMPCTFMGIDRLDFPKVAFFRQDFSNYPLDILMNGLGSEPDGVLVPAELAMKDGLRIGDRLLTSVEIFDDWIEHELVIIGLYEYFPTVYPSETPTLIVNLDSLFEHPDSALGYDIWLNLDADADVPFVIQSIGDMIGTGSSFVQVRGNALDEMHKSVNQPERAGLFGILNVGFIATGLMPGIGFVLNSYASLRKRFIQIGILQAIGLSVRQLIGYLVLEQFVLMGMAIGLGAAIGLITSSLFLPFLQVGAAPGAAIPPFEVLIGWLESAWLSLAFFWVLCITIAGTIVYLARIKVFQAVKMGEMM